VTAECGPPRGADPAAVEKKAALLKGHVDAVNVTDNQTAIVRMSSLAACTLVRRQGLDPVLQATVRDRNRIALQSDLLGASALGIHNVLCLSGDHQCFGDQQQALGVYDLDSLQLVQTVRGMCEAGCVLDGRPFDAPPAFFIGAAANPFGDPLTFRVVRLAKKVAAGAAFIQTQCIYNLERFARWLGMAHEAGLTAKTAILGGVTPLRSAAMARYMQHKVAGMDIPDAVVQRMAGVPKKDQAEEGIKLLCEQVEELKEIPGVAGIHLMAIEWEHKVPEILERAGLLPRPVV
jgi:methylenetetrahydrofolate reductase (NADPH)